MFIISKEVIEYIAKFELYYEESIKEKESSYVLALSVLFLELAIPFIILLLSAFVFDIILSPLEVIIVKAKRSYNERNK